MSIAFDDGIADSLISAAEGAGTALSGQGSARRSAAEHALDDFKGGFAKLFEAAVAAENDDRVRLSVVLRDIVQQVREAKSAAAAERQRLQDLAEWQVREDARSLARVGVLFGGPEQFGIGSPLFDPQPSTFPIFPPTVSGAFRAQQRTRTTSRSLADSTSSADPEALRGFVADAKAANNAMEDHCRLVETAWAGFLGACSWVPRGATSFAAGFRQLIAENRSDETWIDSIARAFEEAGRGTLTNFDISLKVAVTQPEMLKTLLFDGALSPSEVSVVWAAMSKSASFNQGAFVEKYAFELANLDGLPFSVMSQAGQSALRYALDPDRPGHLAEAFTRMGFAPGERSMADFKADLIAVQDAFEKAHLYTEEDGVVQLVSLGRHDGAVTAGISMGNLDAASTVGVFVSGMMSDVRGLSDSFRAFQSIRGGNSNMAMVTWVGYHSPGILEETSQDRADAGAKPLTAFLDGIAAQRVGNPIDRFVTIGHSYGTNVLAEALKATTASVDAYVTLGSAGLVWNTTAKDLRVGEIYATDAEGDQIADGVGQYVQFREGNDGGGAYQKRRDPRDLEGADEFTSEQTEEGEAVTMHNLVNAIDWKSMIPVPGLGDASQWMADTVDGLPADKEVGYLNPEASTVSGLTKIMQGKQEDLP